MRPPRTLTPNCTIIFSSHPTVSAKKLEAKGEVTFLATLSKPPVHLLLAVHSGGGAAVWDMRAQQLVAVVSAGSSRAAAQRAGGGAGGAKAGGAAAGGAVTAAAWLGGGLRGDFATGHANGEVLVWALPQQPSLDATAGADAATFAALAATGARHPPAAAAAAAAAAAPLEPRLLSRLRVAQSAAVRPVASLQYLVTGKRECVLVLGGQEGGSPDGLALLPLPMPTEVSCLLGLYELRRVVFGGSGEDHTNIWSHKQTGNGPDYWIGGWRVRGQ